MVSLGGYGEGPAVEGQASAPPTCLCRGGRP